MTLFARCMIVLAAFVCLTGCDRRNEWDDVKVTAEHVERFARELRLDPAQKGAALDLLAAYQMQHAQALEKMTAYREAYDNAAKPGETPEQRTHFLDTTARFERHCRGLRDGLIADMRALLTMEQGARWPRFERWYRRGDLLPKGTLHGENVDIERLVEALSPGAPIEEAVAAVIDEYSIEIDAAIVARQALLDRPRPKADGRLSPAEMAAEIERAIDGEHQSRLRVRRVNFVFGERVLGALPEKAREKFDRSFDAACYPEVFNCEAADQGFEEVLKLADLTAEQRGVIETIRAEYGAALPEANRRWAEGIRRAEDGLTARAMLAKAGEGGDSAGDDRTARQNLDERTRKRVAAALTPAQRQRLSWLSSTAALPRVEF